MRFCVCAQFTALCAHKTLKSLTCKKAKNTKQFHRVEKDQFQNLDLNAQVKKTIFP